MDLQQTSIGARNYASESYWHHQQRLRVTFGCHKII